MLILHVKIAAVGDPPTFPERQPFKEAELQAMSILEKGMESGSVSVALHAQLQDGSHITMQVSASQFLAAAGAVRGACQRFGDTRSLS